MHDCLVELCTSPRRCIFLAQHLSNPFPHSMHLAKLALHGLDVIVILQELAAKVSEHLDLLQHIPVHHKLLMQSKC